MRRAHLNAASAHELTQRSHHSNTYPSAIALFAAGKLDGVDELVTHRFPLDKAADAFELLRKGADEQGKMAVKVMIGDY